MRLLVVSVEAPPLNTPESIQVGRYLRRLRASDISVLTSSTHGGWRPLDETQLDVEGLRRVSVPVNVPLISRLLQRLDALPTRRPDPDFIFRFSWRLAASELSRPDLIYSRSAPITSAYVGMALKQRFGVPWVMHLSDPWVDNPFLKRSRRDLAYHVEWEKRAFDIADAITVTEEGLRSHYADKYPHAAEKIHHFPNVFDDADVNESAPDFDQFRIVHTGRLYGDRQPHAAIEAFEEFRRRFPRADAEFTFAGFTTDAVAKELGRAPGVRNLSHVPESRARALQRNAHVLVLIDSEGTDPRLRFFFPSKLLDYMSARRPIAALTQAGSPSERILRANRGAAFAQSDARGLADYLSDAYERFVSRDEAFFQREAPPREFSADHNAKRLLELFGALIASRNPI